MAPQAQGVTSNVKTLLNQLRDSPVNSEELSENVLAKIYDYLMKTTETKQVHWFCTKTESTIIEAATFMLRLFAYSDDNPKVSKWKGKLNECLNSCADCVLGLERAKVNSRETCVFVYIILQHALMHL
jgi:senataxin